ncbi:hypothetical protein DRN63_03800 [Nanoarchaeota archaeon]|nr:MAG: hypothetical protein DRN63_03800 [Nanoarchaeota archaeon]
MESILVSWNRRGRCWIEPWVEFEYQKSRREIPLGEFPNKCILCYQDYILKLMKRRLKWRRLEKLLGDIVLYEASYKGKRIGIVCSWIGGPVAALILERLIQRGIKYVLNIGIAGCLKDEGIGVGDVVLCSKALRGDGTSHYYLKPSKWVYPSRELTKKVEEVLKNLRLKYFKGPSITIDAPYRFTINEAKKLRNEVLTSEMEAATVFAVSKFRKVKAAAIFTISDLATPDFKWVPMFHSRKVKHGLEKLFKISLETFSSF